MLLGELLVIDASFTPCREEKITHRGSQALMHTFTHAHHTRTCAHLYVHLSILSTTNAVFLASLCPAKLQVRSASWRFLRTRSSAVPSATCSTLRRTAHSCSLARTRDVRVTCVSIAYREPFSPATHKTRRVRIAAARFEDTRMPSSRPTSACRHCRTTSDRRRSSWPAPRRVWQLRKLRRSRRRSV